MHCNMKMQEVALSKLCVRGAKGSVAISPALAQTEAYALQKVGADRAVDPGDVMSFVNESKSA